MNIRVIFFGTESFALSQLRGLHADSAISLVGVVTQPPRPTGRKQIITKSPVHEYAEQHAIPVLTPTTLREPHIAETLTEYNADIFVVAQYGLIIPQRILDIPQHGSINVHGSLLPRYRGATPVAGALLSGDSETGVSYIVMDAELDHGPVIKMYSCAVDATDTTESVLEKLGSLSETHIASVIRDHVQGKTQPTPQDHDHATFTKTLTRKDGFVAIQDLTGITLDRQVRAYYPWPGVTIACGGELQIKLISGAPSTEHVPPQTIHIDKNRVFIGTRDGSYEVFKIQPSGKPILTATQFANGYKHLSGTVLTPVL